MKRVETTGFGVAVVLAAGGLVGCWTTPRPVGVEPPFDAGSRPPDMADAGFARSPLNIDWGPLATLQTPPPPISGGTLLVTRDGLTAVAADPDRDAVHIVDLAAGTVRQRVALARGDEPGRLAEDAAGRVHVALRRGGAVATIDTASGQVTARRVVCPAPRGIAYDPAADVVHVACAGGELVTLPAGEGGPVRVVHVAPDLRDVIVQGDHLLVSTFRAPSLITVAADGTVATHAVPVASNDGAFVPRVAWRAVPLPSNRGAVMVHQRAQIRDVAPAPGGYGVSAGCPNSSIVQTTVSTFGPTGPSPLAPPTISSAVLPVDIALSSDGQTFALVAPGNAASRTLPQLFVGPFASVTGGQGCVQMPSTSTMQGQAIAVAATPDRRFVVQTREPATVQLFGVAGAPAGRPVVLADDSFRDSGHQIFHANGGGFVACASCHPEGNDDGHVWNFASAGPRRTQSLRFGLLGTEPFHWEGDMTSFSALVHDVFGGRMSGGELPVTHVAALGHWLDTLPRDARSVPADLAAVVRGQAVFADPSVGCANCHGGEKMTNNQTVAVGTGEALQVPSLIGLGRRAPYMHNGCAATLRDRFALVGCGGGEMHGHTAQLAPNQLSDLIAYLESL